MSEAKSLADSVVWLALVEDMAKWLKALRSTATIEKEISLTIYAI
jgi:hypothetical protein